MRCWQLYLSSSSLSCKGDVEGRSKVLLRANHLQSRRAQTAHLDCTNHRHRRVQLSSLRSTYTLAALVWAVSVRPHHGCQLVAMSRPHVSQWQGRCKVDRELFLARQNDAMMTISHALHRWSHDPRRLGACIPTCGWKSNGQSVYPNWDVHGQL